MNFNEPFRAEHRPHGTLAHCAHHLDPMSKVVAQDPRWVKDVRPPKPPKQRPRPHAIPSNCRSIDFRSLPSDQAAHGNELAKTSTPSRREQIVLRRCSTRSAVSRVPPPPPAPFRLGGRSGGSGTPGARAERWAGGAGEPGMRGGGVGAAKRPPPERRPDPQDHLTTHTPKGGASPLPPAASCAAWLAMRRPIKAPTRTAP